MRAERLLRLLLYLQTHRQATVQELAGHLDASARTIQRDLDVLSLAGVPVYSQRGRGGGWQLLPDYRTRLTGLTPAEAISVFAGATAHVLADLGVDTSDTAIDKLLATVPEPARRDAIVARQRLLVDHAGWDADVSGTPRWLDLCRQAVWSEHYVEITYRSRPGTVRVAPLGLVAKNRTWYLIAARKPTRATPCAPGCGTDSGSDGAAGRRSDSGLDSASSTRLTIRTYRLDRITAVTTTHDHFTRPHDFDLARYWAQSQQDFRAGLPSYVVTLRVRGSAPHRVTALRAGPPDEDGWCTVETDLENPGEAAARVLALAGDAIAVRPAELTETIRDLAEEIVRQHGTGRFGRVVR